MKRRSVVKHSTVVHNFCDLYKYPLVVGPTVVTVNSLLISDAGYN